jgi:DNA-binding NarL/FixJ family response regulator
VVRVALLDDDPVVHAALRVTLSALAGGCVVEGYLRGEEALYRLAQDPPSVVLMEVRPEGPFGADYVRRLKLFAPTLPIVVHKACSDEQRILMSLGAGACGYLIKPSCPEELAAAIRAAASGWAYLCPLAQRAAVRFVQHVTAAASGGLLTERERQVLILLAQHLSRKEIASRLGVETGTARAHARRLYEKLHVHNRMEAVAKALDSSKEL